VGELMESIILFDGMCNLCNHSVQFILKRDPKGYFKFASLQSESGQKILKKYNINPEVKSFLLLENEKIYLKSSAALRVCRNLTGMWKILTVLRFIPPFLRDILYDIVAANRYKWFGKTESCMLPSPEWNKRFLP
jgi:predicted DCC family thiol-disulfide oxidoreductase YuxK